MIIYDVRQQSGGTTITHPSYMAAPAITLQRGKKYLILTFNSFCSMSSSTVVCLLFYFTFMKSLAIQDLHFCEKL